MTATCALGATALLSAVGLAVAPPDPRAILGIGQQAEAAETSHLRSSLIASRDTISRTLTVLTALSTLPAAPASRALPKPFERRLGIADAGARPTRVAGVGLGAAMIGAEPAVDLMSTTAAILPPAGVLTSRFSWSRRHPILGIRRPHLGVDLRAAYGTPILAPSGGVVARVAREPGFGLMLEIDHGGGVVTKYAHCSRVLVKAGQEVSRGDRIAAVGRSGLASGSHLHYEVRVDGKIVDPLTFAFSDWAAIPDSIAVPDPTSPH